MKRALYLFNSGTLRRKGNTLYFEREGQRGKYIPIENVREVYLFGEVTFNTKLLAFLSQKEILVHYFNYYGYYSGTFYPREHYNSGYMLLRQVEHYLDMEKRLALARKFVQGALANMLKVLRYYSKRQKEGLRPVMEALEEYGEKVAGINSIEGLMGLEGNARQSYYQAFDLILEEREGFLFEKRSRQPPKNRLNALISFGNSLLYTKILGEIYKTHLDPRIGFLHSSNARRFTLNLDLAEVFKPILVDRVLFRLVNRGQLQAKHFEKRLDRVVLNERGRQIFVQEMEEKLRETMKHRRLNRHVAYHELLRMEAYKVEKHLMGDEEYRPYEIPW